ITSFTVDRSVSAAFALVALAWLTADLRRAELRPVGSERGALLRSLARGSGRPEFTPLVVGPIVAAVFVGTGSSVAVAAALAASAAVTIATARAGGRVLAAAFIPF